MTKRALPSAAPSPQGMTLRDWFAGQFAVAIIQSESKEGLQAWESDLSHPDLLASQCYRLADAMLAERAKAGGKT